VFHIPEVDTSLLREVELLKTLQHPNIVVAYESGELDGRPYIAYEFLEGEFLDSVIRSAAALTFSQKLDVILQVSEALQHIHAGGIVHRDIKPANIMLLRDGNVKLVGFDTACPAGQEFPEHGPIVGTLPFMSPEMVSGEGVDQRAEIFSLGVTFYQLVNGNLPFEGATPRETAIKILHEPPHRSNEASDLRLPDLQAIFDKVLAKQKDLRYQSCSEFREDVDRLRRRLTAEAASRSGERTLDESAIGECWFQHGNVRLHAVAAGPRDGPLVILLHGFPEFWYSWRKQLGALAEAGFRVVVPDQRGYNLSSKPLGIADYAVSNLVADVIFIADQLGADRFFLAGHDWGGAVAWATTLQFPHRLRKLAILNVPHPAVFMRTVRSNPRQMLRSWYMAFFQIPRIPEWCFSSNNFAIGVRSLVSSSRPGTFTADDLERYREAWSNSGAVTAMINWYRALFRARPAMPPDLHVHVPTRILWGRRDRFLLPEMAQASVAFCDSAELTYFADATHWLQYEEPHAVNAALINHFRG
jgi:epoxide hydrolase 4